MIGEDTTQKGTDDGRNGKNSAEQPEESGSLLQGSYICDDRKDRYENTVKCVESQKLYKAFTTVEATYPAAPQPANARPKIRISTLVATAQTSDPTSKRKIAKR